MSRVSSCLRLLVVVSAVSCGGGKGIVAVGGGGDTPSIDLVASSPSVSVTAGGVSASTSVIVGRAGGFVGDVTISIEGVPAGITASAAPATLGSGSTTSTVSVLAASTLSGGAYTLTVRASGSGVTSKTVAIAVNVTAAAVGYAFTTPATLTVQQGASQTAAITLSRFGGFAGAVALTMEGLPPGVTAAFSPASVTGNTSTLTITASPSATVGIATLTVRGTSAGLSDRTGPVTLTVAGAGSTGNTTVDFCQSSRMPAWLAYQDGNGSWTRALPVGTQFRFNIGQGRGGVAWVTATSSASVSNAAADGGLDAGLLDRQEGFVATLPRIARVRSSRAARAAAAVDRFALNVRYGSQVDINSWGSSCIVGTRAATLTVANLSGTQFAYVGVGATFAGFDAANPTFQFASLLEGPLDLFGSRSTPTGANSAYVVDKVIIRRGVNPVPNGTIPAIDFGSSEAFDAISANVTVNNRGSDGLLWASNFFTASSFGTGHLFNPATQASTDQFRYYAVPSSRLASGDLHWLQVVATASPSNDQRFVSQYFRVATDRVVTLGPPLTAPTISTVSTSPYVRIRMAAPLQSQYGKYVSWTASQGNSATTFRTVTVTLDAGALTGLSSYDAVVPDLTAVPGWDNTWGLQVGTNTSWSLRAFGFTGRGFQSASPEDGATSMAGLKVGTFVP